eukprot:8761-Heterococcus_DN1.PRE.1
MVSQRFVSERLFENEITHSRDCKGQRQFATEPSDYCCCTYFVLTTTAAFRLRVVRVTCLVHSQYGRLHNTQDRCVRSVLPTTMLDLLKRKSNYYQYTAWAE